MDNVRPKPKGMVATVSSWAAVEIKRLLFVLCTVIIGCVGEQKNYTWPLTHTRCKGGGDIFSTAQMHIWTNRKRFNTVTSSRVCKKVKRKAKPCCFLSSLVILCCIAAGTDSSVINLFALVYTLHGNASVCTEEEFTRKEMAASSAVPACSVPTHAKCHLNWCL